MAKYQIVEPCTYIVGEQSVQHREAGALVDLDDKTAEALGSAVQALRVTESAPPVQHREKKPLLPKADAAAAVGDPKLDQA